MGTQRHWLENTSLVSNQAQRYSAACNSSCKTQDHSPCGVLQRVFGQENIMWKATRRPRASVRRISRSVQTSNAGKANLTSGKSVTVSVLTCAWFPVRRLCSWSIFPSLDCRTASACEIHFVSWWTPVYAMWDKKMPRHPCTVPQHYSPFYCKQLLTSFCDLVVRLHRRLTKGTIRSRRMFNSLTRFYTARFTIFCGRLFLLGQVKYVAASRRRSALFWSTSIEALESELRNGWICRGILHVWPHLSPDLMFLALDLWIHIKVFE
jgi:hypothetical protein